MTILVSALLPIILLAPPVERAPHFVYMPSVSENSALSMDCEGAPPFQTIECSFTYVDVSVPAEAEVQKKLQEDKQPSAADLAKFRKSFCAMVDKGKLRQDTMTPGQRAELERSLRASKDLCSCSSDACLLQALRNWSAEDLRTCHVFAQTYRLTFTRAGPNRWVSTTGPEGLCASVQVATLERPANHKYDFEWTYTLVRSTVDTSVQSCRPLAAELNKPSVWKWDASRETLLPCKRFSFGY